MLGTIETAVPRTFTVTFAAAEKPSSVIATIYVSPAPTAETRPAPSTCATASFAEYHSTLLADAPSLYTQLRPLTSPLLSSSASTFSEKLVTGTPSTVTATFFVIPPEVLTFTRVFPGDTAVIMPDASTDAIFGASDANATVCSSAESSA